MCRGVQINRGNWTGWRVSSNSDSNNWSALFGMRLGVCSSKTSVGIEPMDCEAQDSVLLLQCIGNLSVACEPVLFWFGRLISMYVCMLWCFKTLNERVKSIARAKMARNVSRNPRGDAWRDWE